ncbi:MAG TPA: hypothetical protein VHC18_13290 [Amycolatopsis sp.]|nr:hypothetical protein [Amycolatopsis sp.]
MKQSSAAEQRGICALRWLVRALFVIGSALAGTAIAWAISSATASAATAHPALSPEDSQTATAGDELTPVTDATMAAADDVVLGASNLVGDTSAAAVRVATGERTPDDARDQQVAGNVSDAVHDFTGTAVLSPVHRVLGGAEHISRKPQDAPRVIGDALAPSQDFLKFLHPAAGKSLIKLPALPASHDEGDQRLPVATPSHEQAAPAAVEALGPFADLVPAQHAATPDAERHGDSGHHQRGDHSGRFPYSPTRTPLSPAGLPLVPGGSAAGGHVDGPLLGVPAGALTLVDTHGERVVRFGIRHMPVEPGEQPGVTPD